MSELPVKWPRRRYTDVGVSKSSGAHYTPQALADFVAAELIAKHAGANHRRPLRILDPAVGDGALILSLLHHLEDKAKNGILATLFDTQGEALAVAHRRLAARYPTVEAICRQESFLEYVLTTFPGGGLFPDDEDQQYDLIIANPPYVRTQVLGSPEAQRLARCFGLNGRVDLYHAFIVSMAKALRPGGYAGIIVSNRFMTVRSGASVRHEILKQFDPIHVWDLGDTKLFEAAVLPAVLLLRKKGGPAAAAPRFTSIYSVRDGGDAHRCAGAIDALLFDGLVETAGGDRFRVSHGLLDHGRDGSQVWRMRTEDSEAWLRRVRVSTWTTLGRLGNIRVGVKTTADKVFIRSDWHAMPECEQPELLRPLTTHRVARRFRAHPIGQQQILYPHTVVGGRRVAVDLSQFPHTEAYLDRHRSTLAARSYILESRRQWFEIWVPQDPNLWARPKLVFRDISERPTFWVDLDGSVVNGDCYWMPFPEDQDASLLWLALAVANSAFIEKFYDRCFNNRLYSGRRRFMTQYVEQFPLPNPGLPVSRQISVLARQIFELTPSRTAEALEAEVDQLVWEAFSVSPEEVDR